MHIFSELDAFFKNHFPVSRMSMSEQVNQISFYKQWHFSKIYFKYYPVTKYFWNQEFSADDYIDYDRPLWAFSFWTCYSCDQKLQWLPREEYINTSNSLAFKSICNLPPHHLFQLTSNSIFTLHSLITNTFPFCFCFSLNLEGSSPAHLNFLFVKKLSMLQGPPQLSPLHKNLFFLFKDFIYLSI